MNISVFASGSHVYSNCEHIKGYAFRNLVSGEKSVHFSKKNDCFECLSPVMYKTP